MFTLPIRRKADVLDFISTKTGLFKDLFKIFVVPEILRNDSGKVQYKAMDSKYAI